MRIKSTWPAAVAAVLITLMLALSFLPDGSILDAGSAIQGLTVVAESENLWTAVAVSGSGRIFVNFPRWFPAIPMSVGELKPDGSVEAFPDSAMNEYDPQAPAGDGFIAVQSLHVDDKDILWILDTGNPLMGGVVEGGAKLVAIDLDSNSVAKTIRFDSSVAPVHSYLNDVRVDTTRGFAFITDSGDGAIIVVNTETGRSRRLLDEHPSTHAEDVVLTVGGEPWLPGGRKPQVHSDGIALGGNRQYIYYQALTGRTLYRISIEDLLDESLDEDALGGRVETVASSGAADGIACGPDGNIYITALEQDAIVRVTPEGGIQVVVQSPELRWPDGICITADGTVYVTTSQLHLAGRWTEPFRLFKLPILQD